MQTFGAVGRVKALRFVEELLRLLAVPLPDVLLGEVYAAVRLVFVHFHRSSRGGILN